MTLCACRQCHVILTRIAHRLNKEKEEYENAVRLHPERVKKYRAEVARRQRAQEACRKFTVSTAEQETVDLRMKDLAGARNFVKNSHIPFKTLHGAVLPKAADWSHASLFSI
jgi:heterodisulfide reductase subunit B